MVPKGGKLIIIEGLIIMSIIEGKIMAMSLEVIIEGEVLPVVGNAGRFEPQRERGIC